MLITETLLSPEKHEKKNKKEKKSSIILPFINIKWPTYSHHLPPHRHLADTSTISPRAKPIYRIVRTLILCFCIPHSSSNTKRYHRSMTIYTEQTLNLLKTHPPQRQGAPRITNSHTFPQHICRLFKKRSCQTVFVSELNPQILSLLIFLQENIKSNRGAPKIYSKC